MMLWPEKARRKSYEGEDDRKTKSKISKDANCFLEVEEMEGGQRGGGGGVSFGNS